MRRLIIFAAAWLIAVAASAEDPPHLKMVADAETGSGNIAAVRVWGGSAALHVNCRIDTECVALDEGPDSATWDCCTGSGTGTCGQWPDSIIVEASPDNGDDYEWVQVDGSSTYTADARDGIFFFGAGEYARAVITDAAGAHECYVALIYERRSS